MPVSPWVRRAQGSALPASDRTGLVRVVPVGPKALRRIERQRTQVQPSAGRVRFDVSGKPVMSTPSVWRNAQMFTVPSGPDGE